MLFCEVCILGDAAFTRKPNDHKHGERVTRVSRSPYLKKAYRSSVLVLVVHIRELRTLIMEELGFTHADASGLHSKHPCFKVSSSL